MALYFIWHAEGLATFLTSALFNDIANLVSIYAAMKFLLFCGRLQMKSLIQKTCIQK